MAVLITGGAGYIGSHTAKLVAEAGYEAVVVDSLERGHRQAVRWGPLVEADLADREALARVFRRWPIEAVIHFAAYAEVGESMTRADLYFRNNLANTLNLLETMKEAGVGTIVFSSTCAIYGNPTRVPIPEDHAEAPVSPYGESKRMVEKALRWYVESHGFGAACLRYFNAAGADPEGEIGEAHDPETHLIPLALKAALGERERVDIYGTDYPTPDGTAVRDYIHVNDLGEAHVQAMRRLGKKREFLALNLGTGHGASVREVVSMVERVTGRPTPVRETDRRAGDPPELVADTGLARQVLGWTPRLSALETIVETAYRWHRRAKRD